MSTTTISSTRARGAEILDARRGSTTEGTTILDERPAQFQPGNGKLKTKEPKDQISIAQKKLKQIIAVL